VQTAIRWLLLGSGLIALAGAACSRSGVLSPLPANPCLAIGPDEPTRHVISAEVDVDRSDILFLIDNSSSMADEIDRIREQLVDVLVPEIYSRVRDAELGVAVFSDFGERELGMPSHPYRLLQPMTDDVDRVLKAARSIELELGGDIPESQLEALYQAATGKGLGVYVERGPTCPEGRRGGVCFRTGSFAIVMLFTDAPMRNVVGLTLDGGDSPSEIESPIIDAPFIPYERGYEETADALRAADIRVVGMWSGVAEGLDDMRRVVRDSGALDESGQPIVIEIGTKGEALGAGVIAALESIAAGTRLDVTLELDDADLVDGLDPRTLVTAVRALRAEPADGGLPNGAGFTGVRAGTRVFFELTFDPSRLPETEVEQRFPLEVRAVASDGQLLAEETLDIVIAATSSCAAN